MRSAAPHREAMCCSRLAWSDLTAATMQNFIYDQPAYRVVFGAGTLSRLREEVERLGAKRPLFILTPGRLSDAEEAAKILTGMIVAIHAKAAMHVPIETLQAARAVARHHDADCIVAFGGGSAIDTSKAVGLELGIPVIAIAMTYGGSEVTPFYGYTEGGIKKGQRDRRMLPKA